LGDFNKIAHQANSIRGKITELGNTLRNLSNLSAQEKIKLLSDDEINNIEKANHLYAEFENSFLRAHKASEKLVTATQELAKINKKV
jgi:hypothetical protein